jgi:hypothetical protein
MSPRDAFLYTVLCMFGCSCDLVWPTCAYFPGSRSWRVFGARRQSLAVSICVFDPLSYSLTVPRQASASQRLGLDLNTLHGDAPGGDLTPSATLVYLEMRREYTRERDD